MSERLGFCTKCGSVIDSQNKFCTNCGTLVQAPQVGPSPEPVPTLQPEPGVGTEKGLLEGIKARLNVMENSAGNASQIAKGVLSPERASEAVRNMLKVMTQVAMDVKKELPADMVNAVDLEAEINLIAFSIGISIDLEQLRARSPPSPPE